MSGRGSWLVALLAIAAIASWWLLGWPGIDPAIDRSAPLQLPGYYLRGVTITQSGSDGKPLYTVEADIVHHNRQDGHVELEVLHMIYSPGRNLPWQLEAERGWIPPARDRIELQGNVLLESTDEESPSTKFRADRLDLYPQDRFATTASPVEMERGELTMSATGAHIDLNQQTLTLQSQVRGRISP